MLRLISLVLLLAPFSLHAAEDRISAPRTDTRTYILTDPTPASPQLEPLAKLYTALNTVKALRREYPANFHLRRSERSIKRSIFLLRRHLSEPARAPGAVDED